MTCTVAFDVDMRRAVSSSLTCSCMRAYDSAMRTTASSWRTVIGTTGVSLSFSRAAARACTRRHLSGTPDSQILVTVSALAWQPEQRAED